MKTIGTQSEYRQKRGVDFPNFLKYNSEGQIVANWEFQRKRFLQRQKKRYFDPYECEPSELNDPHRLNSLKLFHENSNKDSDPP